MDEQKPVEVPTAQEPKPDQVPDQPPVVPLDDAFKRLDSKIADLAKIVQKQVLPGARGKLLMGLNEINSMTRFLHQMITRSGMGSKFGFMPGPRGMQPMVRKDVQPTPPTPPTPAL